MKNSDWFKVFLLILFYLSILFVFKKTAFINKFDKKIVSRYFLSQDIPHEVPGIRQFLSDGDIHISAGYLYINGESPINYNFQHPPLIKYLFGLSILLFNNPLIIQIILGGIMILLTYNLGLNIFKNSTVSVLACLFLIIDPLFVDLATSPLLDLGQGVFLLLYIISVLFYDDNYLLSGLFLGLLFASKFWAGSLFFVGLVTVYLIYIKRFRLKKYFLQLLIGFIVFSLVYAKAFIDLNGKFNIIFFEAKTLKYWLNHSVASVFGSSLLLFISGFYKSWWGKKEIVHSDIWTLFWPVGFIISFAQSFNLLIRRKFNQRFLIGVISIIYLIYLGFQAPFPRYFILILPFVYLVLAENVILFYKQIAKRYKRNY